MYSATPSKPTITPDELSYIHSISSFLVLSKLMIEAIRKNSGYGTTFPSSLDSTPRQDTALRGRQFSFFNDSANASYYVPLSWGFCFVLG